MGCHKILLITESTVIINLKVTNPKVPSNFETLW